MFDVVIPVPDARQKGHRACTRTRQRSKAGQTGINSLALEPRDVMFLGWHSYGGMVPEYRG